MEPPIKAQFLKNCWYVCGFEGEIPKDGYIARQILGERVLLYRTSDGALVAMEDRCPHRLVPLSCGHRVGNAMQCGYHGMVFDEKGQCTHIPGQDQIPSTARVRTYPIEQLHGHCWIWMGDPDLASLDAIPQVPWPAMQGWTAVKGYKHVPADYRLLNDNLLDLSHETYVHEGTIGNSPEQTIADYEPTISIADGQVVHVCREMANVDPPPWFQMILGTTDPIDRWQIASWAAPSINLTTTGGKRAGAPIEDGQVGRVLHLLTPETEHSTHYFYSFSRHFRLDDEALDAQLLDALSRTFDEDKVMMVLQQREILESGKSVPTVAIKVDDGPLRARRILSGRIKREAAGEIEVIAPIFPAYETA